MFAHVLQEAFPVGGQGKGAGEVGSRADLIARWKEESSRNRANHDVNRKGGKDYGVPGCGMH